jgi:putative transposase
MQTIRRLRKPAVSASFRPFSDLQTPEKRRRNLPHWEVPGATYFITLHLADSLPAGVLREFDIACAAWLRAHQVSHRRQVRLLAEEAQQEFQRLFSAREERWLDTGRGCCALRNSSCRAFVLEALCSFDGNRYALDAWVVMPNHVHALVQPFNGWAMATIAASWKKFSARRINATLGKAGQFWRTEMFDYIVRDRDQLERFRRYISDNPIKARLSAGEYELGRGIGVV